MLSAIMDVLKFLVDSDTRDALSAVSKIASQKDKNWKSEIKTASARFLGDEFYKVSEFANYLLSEMQAVGIASGEVRKFETIFTELIHNAFEHGCQESSKCKIRIRCDYSLWFIRLEVSDQGKGFDFNKELEAEYDELHGLKFVKSLAYKFKANKKGNVLTVFIINRDKIKTQTSIERYKGKSILCIDISNRKAWQYLIESWEPLKEVVDNSSHNLILIDCTKIRWVTKKMREAEEVAKAFRGKPGKLYALVIKLSEVREFKLTRFNAPNFRVFDIYELESAKQWLVSTKNRR